MIKQQEFYSIKRVCEILKCSRQSYYSKYEYRLRKEPNTQGRVLFKPEDVINLKREVEKEKKKIKIS